MKYLGALGALAVVAHGCADLGVTEKWPRGTVDGCRACYNENTVALRNNAWKKAQRKCIKRASKSHRDAMKAIALANKKAAKAVAEENKAEKRKLKEEQRANWRINKEEQRKNFQLLKSALQVPGTECVGKLSNKDATIGFEVDGVKVGDPDKFVTSGSIVIAAGPSTQGKWYVIAEGEGIRMIEVGNGYWAEEYGEGWRIDHVDIYNYMDNANYAATLFSDIEVEQLVAWYYCFEKQSAPTDAPTEEEECFGPDCAEPTAGTAGVTGPTGTAECSCPDGVRYTDDNQCITDGDFVMANMGASVAGYTEMSKAMVEGTLGKMFIEHFNRFGGTNVAQGETMRTGEMQMCTSDGYLYKFQTDTRDNDGIEMTANICYSNRDTECGCSPSGYSCPSANQLQYSWGKFSKICTFTGKGPSSTYNAVCQEDLSYIGVGPQEVVVKPWYTISCVAGTAPYWSYGIFFKNCLTTGTDAGAGCVLSDGQDSCEPPPPAHCDGDGSGFYPSGIHEPLCPSQRRYDAGLSASPPNCMNLNDFGMANGGKTFPGYSGMNSFMINGPTKNMRHMFIEYWNHYGGMSVMNGETMNVGSQAECTADNHYIKFKPNPFDSTYGIFARANNCYDNSDPDCAGTTGTYPNAGGLIAKQCTMDNRPLGPDNCCNKINYIDAGPTTFAQSISSGSYVYSCAAHLNTSIFYYYRSCLVTAGGTTDHTHTVTSEWQGC